MSRMNGARSIRLITLLAAALLGVAPAATAAPPAAAAVDGFAARVDLDALSRVAVHTEGRVKSLESFARLMMQFISGPREVDGQTPAFTYFDLMFRPRVYDDRPLIYVKKKLMRAEIADALRDSLAEQGVPPDAQAQIEQQLDAFMETGLIAPAMLQDRNVFSRIARLRTNLMTTARFVEDLEAAMGTRDPSVLRRSLKVVAPPGGGFKDPWMTLDDLARGGVMGLDAGLSSQLTQAWRRFEQSWQQQDADGVNAAAAELATVLPQTNPELYPALSRLSWESWYFRAGNMTWVWLLYGLAAIPLLLFVVFRWSGARWLGLGLFFLAFGLHTFAVLLRWYVADRFPNSNMFEAVTTAAWFGGVFAVLIEHFVRRLPVRCLFALGSAVASMTALMAVHFMPVQLNPHISNMMPVLHDVWLYIHTNVIIFSYCLIFLAAVSAMLYLAYRLVGKLAGWQRMTEYARVGGAASLIITTPDGHSYLEQPRTTLGQVLDGTTMLLMELSFVLLWAGIVMGAIWADHSWGRPWGWDPKEVFALNTFLVFAVLVHTRLKVRDKGLWTALLAVIGCAVMLFNWIIINFTISGLHSYA